MNKILEKLNKIQSELKAPKGQFNKFGNYRYRSCEDILESVKPICNAYGCAIVIQDDAVMVGERYYIKATATIYDTESGESIGSTAYAREEQDKKGMDGSQITGSSSSYARKYALNGLLCIDDTKDSDATNKHGKDDAEDDTPPEVKEEFEKMKSKKINGTQAKAIKDLAETTNTGVLELCKYYGVASLDELTVEQWMDAKEKIERKAKK